MAGPETGAPRKSLSHPCPIISRMDSYAIKRHLDDVETYLRKAKRKCEPGSEVERYIKKALSSLDDAQRQVR